MWTCPGCRKENPETFDKCAVCDYSYNANQQEHLSKFEKRMIKAFVRKQQINAVAALLVIISFGAGFMLGKQGEYARGYESGTSSMKYGDMQALEKKYVEGYNEGHEIGYKKGYDEGSGKVPLTESEDENESGPVLSGGSRD